MIILNVGCGAKVSNRPGVINIDWSVLLRLRVNRFLRLVAPFFMTEERRKRFDALGDNVMVHDLSRGIPFESNSVDVVYHSHMLEHLDRDIADKFMMEVNRVLKPGGLHRIVVPDLEQLCGSYLKSLDRFRGGPDEAGNHDELVGAIIEQCVRREAAGSRGQPPFRRAIENLLLGDARKRGETHQWMYDRINLSHLLVSAGFKDPRVEQYNSSSIPDWSGYYLDQDQMGTEINTGSLYMEANK